MKLDKVTKQFYWTKHAKEKLRYYNLSQQRVKRVFRYPFRVERGIAPETIAAMQRAGSKKRVYEIWIMYQINREKIIIISTWRYPGETKAGERVPIPEDVLNELGIEVKV